MSQKSFPRWLMVAFVAALIILILSGFLLYRAQEQQLQRRAEDELLAVAQLKVDELVAWRAERLGDAALLTANSVFRDSLIRWMDNRQDEDAENLLFFFQALETYYNYSDVALVGMDGIRLLSLSGNLAPLHEEAAQTLAVALRDHQAC
ncbi:MAG: hypothetical protein IPK19_26765 [Chloroflexi bacterium]|nr:hypothetical protein [Chloroflexota bacterium]